MKFKKIIIFICILTICFVNISLADDETEDNIIVENEILEASADNTNEPETYSKHIICIERTTQTVLFEKDAYTKTAMASTTKILTGIIAIENCDLNEVVEISSKAANTGGSTLGISAGQKISMENLLYGLLLRSGNDTAVAIAEYIGGDLEGFAKIMNQKANEIGLKNSNFVTPHGLDDELHYTTAYDLAILTNYALNNETFYKVVSTKQISVNIGNYSRTLINTNELLGNVDGVYGVKTGFTGNAGRCLVSACKRNDLDIIVVVLGADTKKIRGLDSKKVIEYVFNNYQMVDTELQIKKTFDTYKSSFDIQTIKSNDKINLKYLEAKTYIFPVNKNKLSRLRTSIYCFSNILAPAEEGKIIGKIRLICDNNILYELNIVLNRRIERKTWNSYFIDFINGYKDCFKIIK